MHFRDWVHILEIENRLCKALYVNTDELYCIPLADGFPSAKEHNIAHPS